MRKYLSHGMGVNSTALMLILIDEGIEFEAVFSDTGCEWPETYEHINLLKERGYEFTWLHPEVSSTKTLYEYMMKYKIIPAWRRRWCTGKWKRIPLDRYVDTPCTMYIGYDHGERRRRHIRDRKGIHFEYPLIEMLITRQGCEKIIRDHGLPVPRRSGCWFCPFQALAGWKHLRDTYPDLFQKAVLLENIQPHGFTFRKGMRLSSLWQENKLTNYLEVEK